MKAPIRTTDSSHLSRIPIVALLLASAFVAYLIYRTPNGASVYGEGDPIFSDATGSDTEVEILIRPTTIDGVERTPTWRELQAAYRLRPRDIEHAMEIYNHQLPNGAAPATLGQRIREDAVIVLPVQ